MEDSLGTTIFFCADCKTQFAIDNSAISQDTIACTMKSTGETKNRTMLRTNCPFCWKRLVKFAAFLKTPCGE
jgi:hypothetical protein